MEWPSHLSHWLQRHKVNPERVSVVIQVGDPVVAFAIETAFKHELDRQFLSFVPGRPQVIKYCGLNIEIRALPATVRGVAGE